MAYMNTWLKDLVKRMEETFTLSKDWNEFLYQVEQNHNIIIKNQGNMYYCTNCQQTFENKKSKNQYGEMKCPNCKIEFRVKSNKLKHFEYRDTVMMLDKVKDHLGKIQLIVRVFEMRSNYNAERQEFEHSTVEYARRLVYEEYRELRNERIQPGVTSFCVNHSMNNDGKWRLYSGYWYEAPLSGYVYINNLKKILKDTEYENSRLWDAFPDNTREYNNIKSLLYQAKEPSFEMLIELKLYNLAMDAYKFENKGSFKKIFGIGKDYYEFIKKHNLDYSELKMLKLYPTKNIRTLRFLMKHKYVLQEIQEYTSIDNFIKYFRKKHLSDAHLYRDYLGFAKELGFDLKNKKYLFPDRLKTMHDKYMNQVEELRNAKTLAKIKRRAEELSKYIFKNKEFIIFPANSIEALIDESLQQSNCIKNYTNRYSNGKCDIYFMRNVKMPKKSLVTVEVRNNKVVQARIKNNEKITKKQKEFLDIWQKEVLQKQPIIQKKGA